VAEGPTLILVQFGPLQAGDRVIVRSKKEWRFLEDMGYIKILGIPGRTVDLIGSAARDAYLFASRPPRREIQVPADIRDEQLCALGLKEPDVSQYSSKDPRMSSFDPSMQSWRCRRHVDLDDPRSAGFYGRSRDWVDDGLGYTRASLSPEPQEPVLEY
jgi:hypothetical protein